MEGDAPPSAASQAGWRSAPEAPSLREVHGSIAVPQDAGFWRKLFAFAGPGYLVAVGYMDPGNWATDLAGGARYGYTLLSVILISNLMAILLQALAVRLGIASGRDLAQACRDSYSKPVTIVLWVLCEIAIAATDLAAALDLSPLSDLAGPTDLAKPSDLLSSFGKVAVTASNISTLGSWPPTVRLLQATCWSVPLKPINRSIPP